MPAEIIVALLSLLGTAVGSLFGILSANKLTNFRIKQLEERVEKHNNLIERMTVAERDIKHIFYEIDEMKGDKAND